jgi:hypothetical protein
MTRFDMVDRFKSNVQRQGRGRQLYTAAAFPQGWDGQMSHGSEMGKPYSVSVGRSKREIRNVNALVVASGWGWG